MQMKGSEIYQLVIKRINDTFSPSVDDFEKIEKRLSEFDETELQNLYRNFNYFGVNEVIYCLYGVYFDDSPGVMPPLH